MPAKPNDLYIPYWIQATMGGFIFLGMVAIVIRYAQYHQTARVWASLIPLALILINTLIPVVARKDPRWRVFSIIRVSIGILLIGGAFYSFYRL